MQNKVKSIIINLEYSVHSFGGDREGRSLVDEMAYEDLLLAVAGRTYDKAIIN
jgi:hypothetical protein